MKVRAPVPYDLLSAELTPAGVEDFFCPMHRTEITLYRDRLFAALSVAADAMEEEDRYVLGIMQTFFVREAMGMFEACAVVRRTTEAGRPVSAAPNSLIEAVAAGTVGPDFGASRLKSFRLEEGPRESRPWLAPARALRDSLRPPSDGVRRRHLLPVPHEALTSVTISPFIAKHAKTMPGGVFFRGEGTWLGPLRFAEAEVAASDWLGADLAESAGRVARELDSPLRPQAIASLRRWTEGMAGGCRTHLRKLLTSRRVLPRVLWTGSGGNCWTRILRHAVRHRGGEVIGHDHWISVGFAKRHHKGATDFEACDRFMAATQAQAEGLGPATVRAEVVQRELPQIEPAPGPAIRLPARPLRRFAGKTPTVMVATNAYSGASMPWLYHHHLDIANLDWQVRLVAKLKEWDCRVLLKPHPESPIPVPPVLAAMADEVVAERYENACSRADVVLFDWPLTTPFAFAAGADRPLVLVDFGIVTLRSDTRAMLERRCRIVPGDYDGDNRLTVDWGELLRALEEANELDDGTFYETFLRY